MFKITNAATSSAQYLLALIPIIALGYLVSNDPQVITNLKESYKMVSGHIDHLTAENTPLTIGDLDLEDDKFSKRKVKRYLQDAFSTDDILNLHKASIELMETYPTHQWRVQKLTIRVANENGYSFRFHPDDRSIIYRKLTLKELDKILAEEEDLEEEIVEVTPIEIKKTGPTASPIALSIKAFPNPTAEKITVSFTGNKESAILTIVNLQGKEVYREKIDSSPSNFQRIIPIQNYVKGMATIQIEQNGETVHQKVIVVD